MRNNVTFLNICLNVEGYFAEQTLHHFFEPIASPIPYLPFLRKDIDKIQTLISRYHGKIFLPQYLNNYKENF
jgi:hypothetical protein